MVVKTVFCSLAVACLWLSTAPEAYAQRGDRGHRVERLDQLRDRARPQRDERMRDHVVTDRPATRDDTPATDSDRVEETGENVSDEARLIMVEETGYRVRRGEILALDLSDAARAEALAAGLVVIRETQLGPKQVLSVLRGDGFDAPTRIIERLKTADPDGIFTPNHIYSASGDLADSIDHGLPDNKKTRYASAARKLGMIDGQPDEAHPRLASFLADTRSFADRPTGISTHGTAVALRLRDVSSDYLPDEKLELYAADVLSDGEGQSATAEALTEALVWQMGNHVHVLNISLAGPPNEIVAIFIQQFLTTGGQIVAAVGNGGPLSMDIYPAAYEGVIGVTASNDAGDILPLATRGAQVDLTAPGVDIFIRGLGETQNWSGTSYAAPYAAIWLLAADRYGLTLADDCVDAGAPGWDDIYGCGVIGFDPLPRLQLASKQK